MTSWQNAASPGTTAKRNSTKTSRMPAVVSDTSVIHCLAAIGQTELLRFEFGKLFVPPTVRRGLHARPNLSGTAAADSASDAGWFVIQRPVPGTVLNQLFADLDSGEAEAIALACELKPAIALVDETDDRVEIGQLGLPKITPSVDRLMKDFHSGLSRELYDQLIAGD